jgi:hypothetical protein
LGTLLGLILKFLVDTRRDRDSTLQKIIDRMQVRIDHLEKEHQLCLEASAVMREEMGRLRESVNRLENGKTGLHETK